MTDNRIGYVSPRVGRWGTQLCSVLRRSQAPPSGATDRRTRSNFVAKTGIDKRQTTAFHNIQTRYCGTPKSFLSAVELHVCFWREEGGQEHLGTNFISYSGRIGVAPKKGKWSRGFPSGSPGMRCDVVSRYLSQVRKRPMQYQSIISRFAIQHPVLLDFTVSDTLLCSY